MDEASLLYTETHEWLLVADDECTVGITRFAVEQLRDIVYLELPSVGKKLKAGEVFGHIESVKSVNDLYSPVAGEVSAVNQPVADDPVILNQDPYAKGWLIKVRPAAAVDKTRLKDKSGYDAQVASESH